MSKVPKMLRLLYALASDETVPPGVRLTAIRDWLDRAGISGKIEVEVTTNNFDEFVSGVIVSVTEEVALASSTDYAKYLDAADSGAGEVVPYTTSDADHQNVGTRYR